MPVDGDVIVVGAGPTGLMLACELSLAGARPVVLERRPDPGGLPKANGLMGQVVQLLDYRGRLERFTAAGSYAGTVATFPFGTVPLDFSTVGDNPLQRLLIPQPQLERLLTERAQELGVEIRRGHEVLALAQDENAVTLDVRSAAGDCRLLTRYVVGCDGAHSPVRTDAAIGYPGTTDERMLRAGHVELASSVAVSGPAAGARVMAGAVEVPGVGRLPYGMHHLPRG